MKQNYCEHCKKPSDDLIIVKTIVSKYSDTKQDTKQLLCKNCRKYLACEDTKEYLNGSKTISECS